MTSLTAESLKGLPKEQVIEFLSKLSAKQLEELKYDWKFWARDKQLEPPGDWYIWWISAGRSFGKTRAGAEWIREQVKQGHKDIAVIGRTAAETSDVCLYGRSGLLNVCWDGDRDYRGNLIGRPTYNRTQKKLKWPNGAVAKLFSSEEPEALRGSQFSVFWADELGSWTYQQETWDQLQFCMRLGKKPRGLITTTPRSTPLIRSLVKRIPSGDVHLTTGSTFENTAMPDSFFEEMRDKYEGTRLGKQELYAEILEENEGALWTTEMLEKTAIKREDVPELVRIVVAIDPAVTSNAESDMTGIVVAGRDVNGRCYILGDYTDKLSPQGWASKAISLYHRFEADRIVAERNQGGDMVRRTLEVEDETVPIKLVRASRGKYARAEPVSALYERGLVFHVSDTEDPEANLAALETQMRTWEPLGSIGSPDRLDSCVWAITELALGGSVMPEMALSYKSASELN